MSRYTTSINKNQAADETSTHNVHEERNKNLDSVMLINDRVGEVSYEYFFENYLLKNRPCVLPSSVTDKWKSRTSWITKYGKPNLKYLEQNFGSAIVPVADCGVQEYNSQRKLTMKMKDYLTYWGDLDGNKTEDTPSPCLYLKDWHFCREYPNYNAYMIPEYFTSDWLNEYCKSEDDDYQFVYMGPKGTWTPLHMDVFGSFSWSANICGRKKWVLFPPEAKRYLLDDQKKLAYSINEVASSSECFKVGLKVIQEPGEVIFVPSGWYHEVWNLDDCISINHNWFNGCNILYIWHCIIEETKLVENEISDCKDADEWDELCQVLLKAHHGMNCCDFLKILSFISALRFRYVQQNWHAEFDVTQICHTLSLIISTSTIPEFVRNEAEQLNNKLQDFHICGQSKCNAKANASEIELVKKSD